MYLTFSITILTAPSLGAILGGLFTSKFLGSYTNPNALVLCFLVYLLFTGFCIACPFMNSYTPFLIFMWLAVFQQGFIEPIMMGIILNTVSPIERPVASSLSIFIETLIGYMPAPYLYGLIYAKTAVYDESHHNTSRWGMYAVFFSPIIGTLCLLLAILLRK